MALHVAPVGLELGADDYIQKPVSPRVLVARVKSILRRSAERVRTEMIVAPERLFLQSLEILKSKVAHYLKHLQGLKKSGGS